MTSDAGQRDTLFLLFSMAYKIICIFFHFYLAIGVGGCYLLFTPEGKLEQTYTKLPAISRHHSRDEEVDPQ